VHQSYTNITSSSAAVKKLLQRRHHNAITFWSSYYANHFCFHISLLFTGATLLAPTERGLHRHRSPLLARIWKFATADIMASVCPWWWGGRADG